LPFTTPKGVQATTPKGSDSSCRLVFDDPGVFVLALQRRRKVQTRLATTEVFVFTCNNAKVFKLTRNDAVERFRPACNDGARLHRLRKVQTDAETPGTTWVVSDSPLTTRRCACTDSERFRVAFDAEACRLAFFDAERSRLAFDDAAVFVLAFDDAERFRLACNDAGAKTAPRGPDSLGTTWGV
jgi:hypothetical protein